MIAVCVCATCPESVAASRLIITGIDPSNPLWPWSVNFGTTNDSKNGAAVWRACRVRHVRHVTVWKDMQAHDSCPLFRYEPSMWRVSHLWKYHQLSAQENNGWKKEIYHVSVCDWMPLSNILFANHSCHSFLQFLWVNIWLKNNQTTRVFLCTFNCKNFNRYTWLLLLGPK